MTRARLSTLVVEDELPARNYLVELLHTSGLAEVVGAVSHLDQAEQALIEVNVDAAFVDIQLAGGAEAAGLDFVRAWAGREGAPMFVLATAFQEHAIEAFRLGVVDYLLKPFTEERVERCLARLNARRPALEARPLRIVARRGRNLVFLNLDEVWAFEAADRLTFVHTARGKFDLDLSLAAIEAGVGHSLARVHRSWLVNAAHIQELARDGTDTRLLVGARPGEQGLSVPVARERSQAIREFLLVNAMGIRGS